MWVGAIKCIGVSNLDFFGLGSGIPTKVFEASRESHYGINKMITVRMIVYWWVVIRIITWVIRVWITTWGRQISVVVTLIVVWVWRLVWVERVAVRVNVIQRSSNTRLIAGAFGRAAVLSVES